MVACTVVVKFETEDGAKAEVQRRGLERAFLFRAAHMDSSAIVCLDALAEVAAMGVEGCRAAEPDGGVLHDAIKGEGICPYIGPAGIGLRDLGHDEGTVALLDDMGRPAKGATGQRVGIISISDLVIVIMALDPRWGIVDKDLRSCAIGYTDRHVMGLCHQHRLTKKICPDGATIGNLLTPIVGLYQGATVIPSSSPKK